MARNIQTGLSGTPRTARNGWVVALHGVQDPRRAGAPAHHINPVVESARSVVAPRQGQLRHDRRIENSRKRVKLPSQAWFTRLPGIENGPFQLPPKEASTQSASICKRVGRSAQTPLARWPPRKTPPPVSSC
eukprot:scaffold136504_cov35-Tisochrysis_lutea.AAC.1